jgi:HAD superfamily hydrolase (TIGR01549 family)
MKLKPDAILFDMDGVLIDSLDSWRSSLNAALKAHNNQEITKEEFIEKYWGYDLYATLDKIGLDHSIVTACNELYQEYFDKVTMYPDVKDTLQKLKRYKKGIITNTPRNRAIQVIKNFKLGRYFNTVVTSDDVDIGKPNPDIVLKACKNLGIEPAEVVMVGDTGSDLEAGNTAGCTVIGMNIDADFTVGKMSDLADIFEL